MRWLSLYGWFSIWGRSTFVSFFFSLSLSLFLSHTHVYTHTHMYTRTHTHSHTHMYTHTLTHTHVHTHTLTHTHTYTHTHTHTHTHSFPFPLSLSDTHCNMNMFVYTHTQPSSYISYFISTILSLHSHSIYLKHSAHHSKHSQSDNKNWGTQLISGLKLSNKNTCTLHTTHTFSVSHQEEWRAAWH